MLQSNNYDILFEPVKIGPVVAKNRFYQVPHCCGMGHRHPQAHAAMRAVKAEGGWAVISTEETEIHPSSDLAPYSEQRIWDENDIPALRLMTEAVHERGSLAAIELVHNGYQSSNLYSRIPPMGVSEMPVSSGYPKQARRMDKADIKNLRLWHRQAASRARQAGFDIVYVYAGHGMTVAQQFLLPWLNDRTDEYGGSLENRSRLMRELLEETHEEIGGDCAVVMRFAVDELKGSDGMQAAEEGRAVVELLAEIPDLWDVNISDWSNDSLTTRFGADDGHQMPYVDFVKQVTSKPVVAVSKLTSPDLMVSLVRRKIVDFIGAARPSISDPYLPKKVEEGRIDEIRECIGCNICVSCDMIGVPIRCTQNPTMGEEWRRGWHPEKIEPKKADAATLVVGAGPAGLECAMQLGRRGYDVTLAEASAELGGRVLGESSLRGLAAWRRVQDYRVHEIQQKANVEIYTDSKLSAEQVIELDTDNIFIATGSSWRRDGVGRSSRAAIIGLTDVTVMTPDDIMAGLKPSSGPVVIFDDEQGYIGGVIADHLSHDGHDVHIVTSASVISPFTDHTLEQGRVQARLIEQGVDIIANRTVVAASNGAVSTQCVFTGRTSQLDCATLVLVTQRQSENTLHRDLMSTIKASDSSVRIPRIELIGDALAPGLIADAVFAGHLAARNFQTDEREIETALFRREIPNLADLFPVSHGDAS